MRLILEVNNKFHISADVAGERVPPGLAIAGGESSWGEYLTHVGKEPLLWRLSWLQLLTSSNTR